MPQLGSLLAGLVAKFKKTPPPPPPPPPLIDLQTGIAVALAILLALAAVLALRKSKSKGKGLCDVFSLFVDATPKTLDVTDLAGPRCSLVFSEAHNGTIDVVWSKQAQENALAVFTPSRSVPEHFFTTNFGRRELVRECGSPKGKKDRSFERSFTAFAKMAKSHQSRLYFVNGDPPQLASFGLSGVALYFNCGGDVSRLSPNQSRPMDDVSVVAAVPAAKEGQGGLGAQDGALAGVFKATPMGFFELAERTGAALPLDSVETGDSKIKQSAEGFKIQLLPSPPSSPSTNAPLGKYNMPVLKRTNSGRFM